MSNDWELLAELPVRIEGYSLEGLKASVSSEFERHTTLLYLHGEGQDGVGEDVTYDTIDHERFQEAYGGAPAGLAVTGGFTLGTFSEHLAELELFPQAPEREVSRNYRRWAFESAALDLALGQAGLALHEALKRDPEPVRFVVSLRLGEPPSLDPLSTRLASYPELRFKLDPTSSWTPALIAAVADLGVVESVDFKAYYTGSIVDQPPDATLYERVVEAFPSAWIEDPALTPETEPVLADHHGRFSWDAPIHSVADIESLRYEPAMVNIKPSRLGSLRELLGTLEYCRSRGIGNYGGGQFELGPGRGQIQYLASLFHPDGPNDVAPGGYNLPSPSRGLPSSPLAATPSPSGFRWDGEQT